jgi:hypothetical protein
MSLLVVAGSIAAVTMVVRNEEIASSPRTTSTSTSTGGGRPDDVFLASDLEAHFDYLFETLAPDVPSLLDPTTPAFQALEWMAFTDGPWWIMNDDDNDDTNDNDRRLRQRFPLVVLYFATGGIDFWDADWLLPGTSECNFDSITCDMAGTIFAVELLHRSLVGVLPDELSWLTQLRILNLRQNRLRGSIPSGIFTKLTRLQVLDLSFNEFSFGLPDAFLSKLTDLESFSASVNLLTGPLPTTGRLPQSLEYFTMVANHLSGSLPESWWDDEDPTNTNTAAMVAIANALQVVDLGDNLIEGTISSKIGIGNSNSNSNSNGNSWSQLKSLSLYQNDISGTIPSELGRLSLLEELSLAGNTDIVGSLPLELYNLRNLQWLVASHTSLGGTLATNIGNLQELQVLNLVHCPIAGTIPTEIGLLTRLQWLQLANTNVEGTIPNELSELSSLSKYCYFGCSTSDRRYCLSLQP